MTKCTVQMQTHRTAQNHTEHQEVTDIQNKLFFVFFECLFLFCFVMMIS